jgi:hypothetical protein
MMSDTPRTWAEPTEEEKSADLILGAWCYCKAHVGPHSTGWCTVGVGDKIALNATDRDSAFAEVRDMGLPIYGYCTVCYEFIANTYHGRRSCPEHGLDR